MITTDLSKGQLTTILSALCGVRRNPASRADAMAAIEKQAKAIDLSLDDIFAAADGLLDGRMTAAAWRATLRGEAEAETTAAEAPTGASEAEPANEPGTDEPAALTPPEGGTGVASGTQREARLSVKEQLLAACEAADYWLQAELQRPGETHPDDILRTLRAAIDGARRQPRRAATGKQPGQPRADTKQARLIAMLQQGATISEMASELGWLRHTCHGALAGLKKKRGLRITSDKHGGERVYHIVSA